MAKQPRKGLFLTFEGIDGCGKSTQALLTYRFLLANGYRRVKLFREPGSTVVAERIRELLLDSRLTMTHLGELLLYEAARAELVGRELRPALQQGHIVLCDRFYDSTTAYQGYGRRLDTRMVRSLHKVAVGDMVPDVTFLFDVDPRTASARCGRRTDRLETEPLTFHRRVRRGFLEIARRERRRIKIMDAAQPVDDVFGDVKKVLIRRLRLHESALSSRS